MAATRGEDGSHTREQSGYVFLAGHSLLVLGYIFFTVGFATDYWLTTDFGHHGLWEKCALQQCDIISPGELSAWVEGTRAMQTMALMCFLFGVLAGLLVHCVTHTFPPHAICSWLQGKARVLEIFTAVGCAFCLIGVSVFGGKGKDEGKLGYSFGLSVFSLFLTAIGAIMVAVARNAVTDTLNRISPDQQIAVVSVSASSNPRLPQHPQSLSSATYPYGQGHLSSEQPNRDRGGHSDTAYGSGATSPAPSYPHRHGTPVPRHPPQALPNPMDPMETGSSGTMSMPEPGPIGGEGGRGVGQPRGSGRLPPITEVTPSAPPFPPPSGEQPPSYLEAIGHAHT